MDKNKRVFLKRLGISAAGTLAIGATPLLSAYAEKIASTPKAVVHATADSDFKISLTQWALHRSFLGDSIAKGWGVFADVLQVNPDSLYIGSLHPDNFPTIAADTFGIYNIELVNTFYYGKTGNHAYWDAFKAKCDQLDVSVGLILCRRVFGSGSLSSLANLMCGNRPISPVNRERAVGCVLWPGLNPA